MTNLSTADRKIVQQQLKQLPLRTKAAQEKEMGDMMDKLKEVSCILYQVKARHLLVIAWQRYFEAFWSVYGEFPNGQGREYGRIQYEFQPRREIACKCNEHLLTLFSFYFSWEVFPRSSIHLLNSMFTQIRECSFFNQC